MCQEIHPEFKWLHTKPLAPCQDGLYERLVGLTKNNLKKAIGKKLLTFIELQILFTQVEAILNTRPLCYLDNKENIVLTPAKLLNIPNLVIKNNNDRNNEQGLGSVTEDNLYKIYKKQKATLNMFRQIWQGSYLQTLKERLIASKRKFQSGLSNCWTQ